jgi:hypothetical protein
MQGRCPVREQFVHIWSTVASGCFLFSFASPATGTVMPMAYSRQWLVDTLRRLGFPREADEALQTLPDEIDRKQLLEFADRHGIDSSTLADRMGGSP